MKFVCLVLTRLLQLLLWVWLIIATIPLLIGILMYDLVLRIYGVEKTFLLLSDFNRWIEMLNVYLKTIKSKTNKNTGEDKEYV